MLFVTSSILGIVAKHSGDCHQTFRGMPRNIPGNVAKLFRECRQTYFNAFLTAAQSSRKNYHFYGKVSFIEVYSLLLTSNVGATGIDFIKMADGRGEMSNELNYILNAIELIKMKKDGQQEEKIIQICKQEFGLSEKEVLDSLKETDMRARVWII